MNERLTQANRPKLVAGDKAELTGGLIHRVQQPTRPGPHPTVVLLHGRSGDENAMWVFSRVLPDDWLVIAPRGIKSDPAGGWAWQPRQRDEWPSLASFQDAVDSVAAFIRNLPQKYNSDPDRIYLMGFSQGAATSYAVAMTYPDLVQGIAGLVGFVPGNCGDVIKTGVLIGLPIFMAVGKEDPFIPYNRSSSCAETLQQAGADLTYHDYETGHRLTAQGMRDLKAWWGQFSN